jgi:hypothetical protein
MELFRIKFTPFDNMRDMICMVYHTRICRGHSKNKEDIAHQANGHIEARKLAVRKCR